MYGCVAKQQCTLRFRNCARTAVHWALLTLGSLHYHTFLGKFQPTFSISGPGDGFKKRYAFLIIVGSLGTINSTLVSR